MATMRAHDRNHGRARRLHALRASLRAVCQAHLARDPNTAHRSRSQLAAWETRTAAGARAQPERVRSECQPDGATDRRARAPARPPAQSHLAWQARRASWRQLGHGADGMVSTSAPMNTKSWSSQRTAKAGQTPRQIAQQNQRLALRALARPSQQAYSSPPRISPPTVDHASTMIGRQLNVSEHEITHARAPHDRASGGSRA